MSPITNQGGSMNSTSKLPQTFAQVPASIISLSGGDPRVLCNLRPSQRYANLPKQEARRARARDDKHDESYFVEAGFKKFLRTLSPGEKILIHFQGFVWQDVSTAVARLGSIYWDYNDAYPRLRFDEISGELEGVVLWGAYVLAIALAPASAPLFTMNDDKADEFVRIARTL